MSAICSFVSIYSNLTTFWDTCFLKKWYLIGIWFVLECITWFLDMFIAFVLSQCITMGSSYFTSKSSNICFIQMTCVQHDATTIYLTYVVDSEMKECFFLSHDTKQSPKYNVAPLVLFLSSILLFQSTSVNSFRVNLLPFGYHNP